MNEWDLDIYLARAQFKITVYWLTLVAGIFTLEGLKIFDRTSIPNDAILATTGVIIYFWFNRNRPPSPIDGTGSNGVHPIAPKPLETHPA